MPYHDSTVLSTRSICTRSHFGWKSPCWTVLEMSSPNFPAFRNVSLFFLPPLQSALAGSKAGRCHLRSDARVWIEQMCRSSSSLESLITWQIWQQAQGRDLAHYDQPCHDLMTNINVLCNFDNWVRPARISNQMPPPLLTDLFGLKILYLNLLLVWMQ